MGFWDDVKNVGRGAADATGFGLPFEAYNEFTNGGLYGQHSTLGYGLDQLTNPNIPNPADGAMKYLDQIPAQLKDIYGQQKDLFNPYIQQGKDAYGQLNPIYGQMAQDPAAYLDNMMKGYAPSRSYQLKKDEMLRGASNTAAAGGMRGTGSDVTAQAKLTDSLMGDDMQQWLNNTMGLQGRGMQGLGNFYDAGLNATGQLGQAGQAYGSDLANLMGTKAQLAFQGSANQNQATADRRNMWINGASNLLGAGLGGAIKKWG